MENASKALLIAASVLIVILLIAFGMSIFKSGTGTGDALEVTMTATEKASFNSKFTAYCGSSVLASKAKSLAQVIISNNATSTHKVSVTVRTSTYSADNTNFETDLTNAVSELSGMVKIEVGTYTDGIVSSMKITQ